MRAAGLEEWLRVAVCVCSFPTHPPTHPLSRSPAHTNNTRTAPAQPAPRRRAWTPHTKLREWVAAQAALCKPERLHLVSGSDDENA